MGNMRHITSDAVYEYLNTKQITDDNYRDFYEISLHLSQCEECMEKMRLGNDLKILLDSWTPESHGELLRQGQSEQALKPVWRERIQKWLSKYPGMAEAALRVVFDTSSREASRIITEGLEKLLIPNHSYNFERPVFANFRSFGEGTDNRSRVRAIDKKTGSEVKINLSESSVNLKLGSLDPQKIPLVLLVAEKDDGAVRVAEPCLEKDGWVAKFNEIPCGEYLLMIEPLDE